MTELVVRPVTPQDIELICRQRVEMFSDAGRPDDLLQQMAPVFRDWLEPRLIDGRYFGFIAELAGRAVGGVGLIELDWPPHPLHPTEGRRGYVLNVFVEEDCRGLGIARQLMAVSEDAFSRRGLTFMALHATEKGRILYDRMGWSPSAEMTKPINLKGDLP